MTRPICAALLALALLAPAAHAQQSFDKEALINSLQASGDSSTTVDVDAIKKDLKNAIAVEPATPAGATTRGFTPPQGASRTIVTEANPNTVVLQSKPNINLEVFFDYNSSVIKPESKPQLNVLAEALQDQRLSRSNFLIAGHTDGAGSREYNFKLSQERADAIRRYLISTYPIEAARLQTLGYGKEKLRDPANPEAAINRRVQIVNIGN